ncbi:hypothetical protein RRG08_046125 [Elysia crispata]|uniref:G-protein coupled receptors family 1 profile domain-containing protein n=1 Tax=Elysia crispata TaxID=231223 RepID=A0AAE0Y7L2_9GAST|nr:hypothetical protein RRG08_046125 [Elysia crispata]
MKNNQFRRLHSALMGSNTTDPVSGQSGTEVTSTSDLFDGGHRLWKSSCTLNLKEAELPIIFVFTLAVNLLALAVLVRMRASCDTLDHLLVSILNINDILTTGIFTFMWISGWASCDAVLVKPIFCGLFGWVGSALVVWSAFIIVIMTSFRFLSLVKPLYFRTQVNAGKVIKASVGTLVFCLVFFLPPFTGYTAPYRIYEDNHICAIDFAPGAKGFLQRPFIGATGVIGCLTVLHVALCNCIIVRTLRKRNTIHVQPEIRAVANSNRSGFQGKRRMFGHVTLVVSFVYALCYAPFVIRLLVDTITNLNHQDNTVHSVSMSLLFLSPLLNPIVYGVFNRHFRLALSELLRGVFVFRACRRQEEESADNRMAGARASRTAPIDINVYMARTVIQSYQNSHTSSHTARSSEVLDLAQTSDNV